MSEINNFIWYVYIAHVQKLNTHSQVDIQRETDKSSTPSIGIVSI